MDYKSIQKGAVPHVTTLGQHFQIEYQNYYYTLIMECSFIILVLPLLAIWIYFSSKYKQPKKQVNLEAEDNIQAQKSQFSAQSKFDRENDQQNKSKKMQQYSLEPLGDTKNEEIKKKLNMIERKLCNGLCYFILHVVSINSFDSGIISIVTFYLTALLYVIFNIAKPKKNFFLLSLFILPTVGSAVGFWIGSHKLGNHIQ